MQTFSSDRKRVLRILLTLHQVPVGKKKRNRNGPEKKTDTLFIISVKKKKGKRHQQLQNATFRIVTINKLKIALKVKKTKTCQSYQLIIQISLSLACKTRFQTKIHCEKTEDIMS